MPCTTVQKITGAIIILISAMKPSPSGFKLLAEIGIEIADQHAERDRDQDLDVEDLVPGLVPADGRLAGSRLVS